MKLSFKNFILNEINLKLKKNLTFDFGIKVKPAHVAHKIISLGNGLFLNYILSYLIESRIVKKYFDTTLNYTSIQRILIFYIVFILHSSERSICIMGKYLYIYIFVYLYFYFI